MILFHTTNTANGHFSKNRFALLGLLFVFCVQLANSVESKNLERVLLKKKAVEVLRMDQEFETGIVTEREKRDFGRTFYRAKSSLGPGRVDLKYYQNVLHDRPDTDESSIDTYLIGPDEKFVAILYEQVGEVPRLRLYEALTKKVLFDLSAEGGAIIQFSDTGESLDVVGSKKAVVFDSKGRRWAISFAGLDIKDIRAIRLIGKGDTCLILTGSSDYNFYRFGINGTLKWKYPGKFIFDVSNDVIYYSKIDVEDGVERIAFGAIELISGNELWSKILSDTDALSGERETAFGGLEPLRVLTSKHKIVLLLGPGNLEGNETKIVVFDKAGNGIGHATLKRSVGWMSDGNMEEFTISANEQDILIRNQFERVERIRIGNE